MITNAPPPIAIQNQIGTPSGYTPNKVKSVNSEASSEVGFTVVELKGPVDSLASLVDSVVFFDDNDDVIVATNSVDSIREDFSVGDLEIVDVGVVSVSDEVSEAILSCVVIISPFVVDALVVIVSTLEVVDIKEEVVELETISTLGIEVGMDSWAVSLSESFIMVLIGVDDTVSMAGSVWDERLSDSYKQALMIHSS